MGTTSLIYALFRMRLVTNGFFMATILGMNSANGCLRANMPIVQSWSYDSYFVLQYLPEHDDKYNVIMRGAKVLSLTVDMFNIRFIDSLNFPMRLANFPKTFGIEELAKGHFPHLINQKENENYVDPIPPAPYYNPNRMNPKGKETFMTWHTSKKESNYIFNLQEEIIAYCRPDVDILRRCCLECDAFETDE